MVKLGIYKHFKNKKKYQVIGISLNTHDHKKYVIYKPLYKCENQFFTRSVNEFIEIVINNEKKAVKRFELIENKETSIFDLFDVSKIRLEEKDILIWKIKSNNFPVHERNTIINHIKQQLTKINPEYNNQTIFIVKDSIDFEVKNKWMI